MMRRGDPEAFAAAIEGAAPWEWALVVVIIAVLFSGLALAVREYGFRGMFFEESTADE